MQSAESIGIEVDEGIMANSLMNEFRVLEALATMPFLESTELSAVAALATSTTDDVLRRLLASDLLEFVRHSRSERSRVRRWFLTRKGVEDLAQLRLKGESAKTLISEYSVSAQLRRYILRRLDAVVGLYRVAQDAASAYDEPLEWKWSRSGALDGMMRMPDGRSAGLSRIGSTHSGRATGERIKTLNLMYARGQKCPTLMLVPGPVVLKRVLDRLKGRGLPVFVADEEELMRSPTGRAIWFSPDEQTTGLSLAHCIQRTPPSELPRTRQPSTRRLTLQADKLGSDVDELDMAACELTTPARRILRLLFDWPFIRVSQLQTLLGMSEGHLRREKALLSRLKLIHHLRIGRTPKQRYDNGTRLCLSRDGIQYLSRTDRSLLQDRRKNKRPEGLLDHWLVEPDPSGDEAFGIAGFLVKGSKAKGLLKERGHTDRVYGFAAMLAESCRTVFGWRIEQILPAHRWERRFRHGRRAHSVYKDDWRPIKPDATILISRGERRESLLLELERRATKPSKMDEKMQPMRNYFASSDTVDDFPDGRPDILVVFEAREDASRFAVHAANDGGPIIPMHVSSLQQLGDSGIFGRSWISPWRINQGNVPLEVLL